MTKDECIDLLGEIMDFAEENKIISYYELKTYAYQNDKHDWLECLHDRDCQASASLFLTSYKAKIKAKYTKQKAIALIEMSHARTEYHHRNPEHIEL